MWVSVIPAIEERACPLNISSRNLFSISSARNYIITRPGRNTIKIIRQRNSGRVLGISSGIYWLFRSEIGWLDRGQSVSDVAQTLCLTVIASFALDGQLYFPVRRPDLERGREEYFHSSEEEVNYLECLLLKSCGPRFGADTTHWKMLVVYMLRMLQAAWHINRFCSRICPIGKLYIELLNDREFPQV